MTRLSAPCFLFLDISPLIHLGSAHCVLCCYRSSAFITLGKRCCCLIFIGTHFCTGLPLLTFPRMFGYVRSYANCMYISVSVLFQSIHHNMNFRVNSLKPNYQHPHEWYLNTAMEEHQGNITMLFIINRSLQNQPVLFQGGSTFNLRKTRMIDALLANERQYIWQILL
jgi:hypothetical protein